MDFLTFFGCADSNKQKKKKPKKKYDKDIHKKMVLSNVKLYASQLMGSGPKKQECQDTCSVIEGLGNNIFYFAVYDGHGSSGRQASQTASDSIQSQLQKSASKQQLNQLQTDQSRIQYLEKVFKNTQKKLKASGIDYSNSGTCAISVYIQGGQAYICNLGDSRAIMFRVTPKEKLAIELSYDHKPTRPDQRQRIQSMGGKIYRLSQNGHQVGPPRVWADQQGPGIAMSRTLGDLQGKKIGLISQPEIQHIELQHVDKFIVIGSDGVWDVMSSAQVCGFVNLQNEQGSAEALVNECKMRWQQNNRLKKNTSKISDLPYLKYGRDDISCIIAYLKFSETQIDQSSKQ